MAEQPLSSDHEAALVLSAPAQRRPPETPRARRWPWSGIILVRLAVLLAAGVKLRLALPRLSAGARRWSLAGQVRR
jgi:hypothetical protein